MDNLDNLVRQERKARAEFIKSEFQHDFGTRLWEELHPEVTRHYSKGNSKWFISFHYHNVWIALEKDTNFWTVYELLGETAENSIMMRSDTIEIGTRMLDKLIRFLAGSVEVEDF